MTPVQLPEVPEPFMELRHYLSPAVYDAWADQLRAYATAAVLADRASRLDWLLAQADAIATQPEQNSGR